MDIVTKDDFSGYSDLQAFLESDSADIELLESLDKRYRLESHHRSFSVFQVAAVLGKLDHLDALKEHVDFQNEIREDRFSLSGGRR